MTGLKKIKTAVLISGRGSNLYNLIKFSKTKKSPILIDLIVSNKKNAIGLKYAKKTFFCEKCMFLFYVFSLHEEQEKTKQWVLMFCCVF